MDTPNKDYIDYLNSLNSYNAKNKNAYSEKNIENDFYDWVGVVGTFTTTAALVQRIPWQQREKIHHFKMTINDVKDAMNFLAPMPLEERLKLPCLQPQRADIVVHGIAILLACMQELNIHQITVSEHGNLEGYLKLKYIFEK